MKKISLALLLVVLLVGVSADAQKKGKETSIVPATADICVDSQNGEGFIVFNPETQEFSCHLCKYGWVWSGTGKVEAKGMYMYFNAMTDRYRIFVSLNVEAAAGKAVIQVLKDVETGVEIKPVADYFADEDIYTNAMSCLQGK